MAKKYLINNNRLLMSASVDYHKELCDDHSTTKGGGLWHKEGNNLYLYASSLDYGTPNIEDVKSALNDDITAMRVESYNIFYSTEQSLSNAFSNNTQIQSANDL